MIMAQLESIQLNKVKKLIFYTLFSYSSMSYGQVVIFPEIIGNVNTTINKEVVFTTDDPENRYVFKMLSTPIDITPNNIRLRLRKGNKVIYEGDPLTKKLNGKNIIVNKSKEIIEFILPEQDEGYTSDFIVKDWVYSPNEATKGKYHIETDINVKFNFESSTLHITTVNPKNPYCHVYVPNGNNIDLGTIIAGNEKTKNITLHLDCQEVYNASINFKMDNILNGSDGKKATTLEGGFLSVLDKNKQIVKIDGSEWQDIISYNDQYHYNNMKYRPKFNESVMYSIVNNAKNVITGGRFSKKLNVTIRMN
ncbi:hypothetical protein [Photobacterium leiognathi]|uniref:hypothetical protein n=1 Tax=Photobacterium leiognathi TaxID=553611 RepID=UPI002981E1C3|nr:hypothetical protein [Photobacterium leiognathi]